MSQLLTKHGGASHGSVKSYLTGFVLSIILTVLAFAIVMSATASRTVTITVVTIAAVIQILVHLVYFLHMNTSSKARWNLVVFLFTLIIIGIVVVGSLWIMYNLNLNMIPD